MLDVVLSYSFIHSCQTQAIHNIYEASRKRIAVECISLRNFRSMIGLLAHIFREQVASLMLCDRTKKKMTFVGFEPTPPAIRAVVLTN